jgi:crotonobetaine/carnitine-CoA ligase
VRVDQLRCPHTHQFSGTDVWDLLNLRADRTGDHEFLIWEPFVGPGRRWTYSGFRAEAAAIAAGLEGRGVKFGDRILIHLENCPEFLFTWFACAALGAVAVTTNSRSAQDEVAYYASDSAAVGAITQPRFAEMVALAAPELRWLACIDHNSGEPASSASQPDGRSSFSSLRGDPNSLTRRAPDPMAHMSVQYTSGTTARPKGVVWTHANALWSARVNAVHEDLHPDDCHLTYMPLFHTNAMAYSVLASLWVGARFVLVPKWSTSRFWDISLRERCSWLSLMGLSARAIISMDPRPGHHYRLFGTGLCDPPWQAPFGVKTIGWWGMTETVSHGIVGDPYTPNRPMSMGRPAPEYGIAVVRADGVTPTEPEETGQLLVKGTPGLSLFAEYLNKPEATADAFDEWGWMRTGDLVVAHADGYLSFVDRAKDMLKVGAENVAASEIERVMSGVAGVAEAAVVGRPDPKLDEVPVAFVVATHEDDSLAARVREACANQLADFKVPRDVYVVAGLPRSTISKVNKVELRRYADPEADRQAAALTWLAAAASDPSGDAA